MGIGRQNPPLSHNPLDSGGNSSSSSRWGEKQKGKGRDMSLSMKGKGVGSFICSRDLKSSQRLLEYLHQWKGALGPGGFSHLFSMGCCSLTQVWKSPGSPPNIHAFPLTSYRTTHDFRRRNIFKFFLKTFILNVPRIHLSCDVIFPNPLKNHMKVNFDFSHDRKELHSNIEKRYNSI